MVYLHVNVCCGAGANNEPSHCCVVLTIIDLSFSCGVLVVRDWNVAEHFSFLRM